MRFTMLLFALYEILKWASKRNLRTGIISAPFIR